MRAASIWTFKSRWRILRRGRNADGMYLLHLHERPGQSRHLALRADWQKLLALTASTLEYLESSWGTCWLRRMRRRPRCSTDRAGCESAHPATATAAASSLAAPNRNRCPIELGLPCFIYPTKSKDIGCTGNGCLLSK